MKKLILTILSIASLAQANYPPTTSQGQSDATKTTTFDFQAPMNQITKTSGTAGLIETGNTNLLKNPGFEAATFSTNWTASGGSFTQGSSANIGTGLKGAIFTPSAGSQTVTSDAITIPKGHYGVNAEVSCYFKTSGTDYTLSAYDGSNTVGSGTIVASTNFSQQRINFVMPTSGTIALRVTSGSAASSVTLDDCYVGPARNLSSQTLITDWSAYTATFSAGFGTVSTQTLKYRLVGNVLEVQGTFVTGTVAGSLGSVSIPSIFTIDSNRIPAIVPIGRFVRNQSSTAINNFSVLALTGTSTSLVYLGGPLGDSSATAPFSTPNISAVAGNSETISIYFSVPITGTYTGTAITLNMTGSYYSGYHDATCAWARTNTAYGAFTADASCALTQRQASGIGAIATGSVLPALALTLPATGTYYVCAYVNSYAAGNGGLRMTDGTTVIVESNDQSTTRTTKALCGSYVASSLTPTISIEGKSSSGAINIDTTTTSSAIEWTIFPITNNMPSPVLVGSVSSNSTGAERIERAAVTSTCSASPCTIASQSGSWLTNITRASTGNYTFNFASGMFSSAPVCNVIANGLIASINTNPTTSSVIIDTKNTAGTNTDGQFFILCMGPR